MNISVSDAGTSPSTCKIDINGTNQTVSVSSGWCNITNGFLTNLADGNRTINVYANDSANNFGLNNSYVVDIDITNPLILDNPSSDANLSIFTRNWILVNVSASDTNLDSVRLSWNNINETFETNSGNNYWENKSSLSDGNYSFYSWANDTIGNRNFTGNRTITIDTTSPVVTFGTNLANNSNRTNSSVTFELKASDGIALDNLELWGNWTGSWVVNQSNTSLVNDTFWNVTVDAIPNGKYIWGIRANDTAGNQVISSNRTFTIDTTNPVTNFYSPNNNTFSNNLTRIFVFNQTDNIDLKNSTLNIWNSTENIIYGNDIQNMPNKSGGTFADNSGVGTITWSNPNSVVTSNDVYATAFVSSPTNLTTHYLQSSNYGFSIPNNAVIRGILIEIEKSVDIVDIDIALDHEVKILKGGTYGSENKRSGVPWSTSDTYVSYGGETDLWGETWTSSDINNIGFGVSISANGSDGSNFNFRIDHFRITVYYSGQTSNIKGTSNSTSFAHTFSSDGVYLWNSNSCDNTGNCAFNSTNYTITFDTTNPLLDYVSPTNANNSNLTTNYFFINTTLTETNFQNMTFNLFHNNLTLINSTVISDSTRSINFTGLVDGNYIYNVSVLDKALNSNETEERYISLDSSPPLISILSPESVSFGTNTTFRFNITDSQAISSCKYNVTTSEGQVLVDNTYFSNCGNAIDYQLIPISEKNNVKIFANNSFGLSNITEKNFSVRLTSGEGGQGSGVGGVSGTGEKIWHMTTETGGQKYTLTMVPDGLRTKKVAFENLGNSERIIRLSCEDFNGTLCKYVTFQNNTFVLPPVKEKKYLLEFTIKPPTKIENGRYYFNIIGTDDSSKKGSISVEVIFGEFDMAIRIASKFISSKNIFGLNIQYWILFAFILLPVLSFITNLVLKRFNDKNNIGFSIIIGFFLSLVVLSLPIVYEGIGFKNSVMNYFVKILSTKNIFGLNVPYLFIYVMFLILISYMTNLVLKKSEVKGNKTIIFLSILTGAVLSSIIMIFI